MKKSIYYTLFLLVLASAICAQTRLDWYTYAEEAFATEEYSTAAFMYTRALEAKDSSYKNYAFPYAMGSYKKKSASDEQNKNTPISDTAKKTNSNNIIVDIKEDYLYHQIAESYRLAYSYDNAEIWYQRSLANKSANYPNERYWYAYLLMKNGKYSHALVHADTVKKSSSDNYMRKQAERIIANCNFATNVANEKKDVVSILDSTVNKGFSSLAVSYYGADSVVFSAARKPSLKEITEERYTDNSSLQIYSAKKSSTGSISNSKLFSGAVNSGGQEYSGSINADNSIFYFTKATVVDGKKEQAIYFSKKWNGKWLTPFKLNENINLPGYRSMQPSVSADGKKLYFSSDKPGGYGKLDIWQAVLTEDGNAKDVINMGAKINTNEDETTPFYHSPSSTLFFSSEGHVGFGGLDVFKTKQGSDSVWITPKNLGSPINSSRDDAYFVLDKDLKNGFLSTDKNTCKDCGTTNCYVVYAVKKEANTMLVKGYAYNSETNEKLPNTLLTFKDAHGDLPNVYVVTDSLGMYMQELAENTEYFVKAQKNKFFADANTVSTLGATESLVAERDFYLAPIPQSEIVIPGIEYDYDKATLRPASIKILNDLNEFLQLNNNISVQISSHTDERGTDEYNFQLSNARAKSVVDYLVSKGIAPDRLLPQGFGKTQPLIPFEEIDRIVNDEEREAAHQRNRRTAFLPIKEDEIGSGR